MGNHAAARSAIFRLLTSRGTIWLDSDLVNNRFNIECSMLQYPEAVISAQNGFGQVRKKP